MAHEGGCYCGRVRYRLTAEPMIVHACHCRQCQRLSGSAFVLNALIEKGQLELLSGTPKACQFEGTSQTAFFCEDCGTYVWSAYTGRFEACWFVKVGTLDEPDARPPDVHICTSSKQPWVVIPEGTLQFPELYALDEVWTEAGLERLKAAG